MKIKEYLKTQRDVNTSTLASCMWPDNKTAYTYLSNKLNGKRKWTEKDEVNAKRCLHDLGDRLVKL